MNWELFYAVCFVAGFTFSAFSFLSGVSRIHFHLPKFLHFGGAHGAGAIGTHAGHAGHSSAATHHGVKTGGHFPAINPMTMASFLTWFGGIGYLLVRVNHMWIIAALGLALLSGTAGAAIIFWFVGKVLMSDDQECDPLDYDMVGVLGRVSSAIRAGGTGEIIFTQEGVLRPSAARSEDGKMLLKGEEVVVMRYERGIAYVRRWEELANKAG